MKLKIMTFNLRYTDDKDGQSIAERAPRALEIIREYDPDIIGFQEAVPKWMDLLEVLGERYDHYLMYRHEKSKEGTPLFWKKELFEAEELKHFWLSETPAEPSKGFGAHLWRICCYGALKHKESGKAIHVFNTHFDWIGSSPRESGQLVIRRAEVLGDAPVFVTADYNFHPDSAGWHSMRSYFYDAGETLGAAPMRTCHGYRGEDPATGTPIDYCFYRGKGVTPTKYEVVTRTFDGKYPSDHFPIYFEFEVE